VWSADFTGHFQTGDGRYGSPLTITEGYRRVLLSCHALSSTSGAEATPVCTRVFKAFGVPQRLRPGNGVPCATHTLARLSQVSAW
jgi:putative transposase